MPKNLVLDIVDSGSESEWGEPAKAINYFAVFWNIAPGAKMLCTLLGVIPLIIQSSDACSHRFRIFHYLGRCRV